MVWLHSSSHLATGTWGVTAVLASFDPGTALAGAQHCTSSISVQGGGAAHTAQAADGLTQSQPAAAPQSPRKLSECETKGMLACAHQENKLSVKGRMDESIYGLYVVHKQRQNH